MSHGEMKNKRITKFMLIIPIILGLMISSANPLTFQMPNMPINRKIASQISVLYIYGGYATNYTIEYQNLFAKLSFIDITSINISDFMKNANIAFYFNVLLVGHSSFNSTYSGYTTTRSNNIINTGKPILAMGSGGGTFFQGLGYDYGGGGMGFTSSGLSVNSSEANHVIFNQYYSFSVPSTITYSGIFTQGVYMPGREKDTNFLATDSSNTNYAPLLENFNFSQKLLYFGIGGVPNSEESNSFKLIHNCIEWLSGFVLTTTTTISTTTTPTTTVTTTPPTTTSPTTTVPPTTTTPSTTIPSTNTSSTTYVESTTTDPLTTTPSTTIDSTTVEETTTEETSTTTEEDGDTTPTLNISPGFTFYLLLIGLLVIIPTRRFLKRK
jgi:hypothetical protein